MTTDLRKDFYKTLEEKSKIVEQLAVMSVADLDLNKAFDLQLFKLIDRAQNVCDKWEQIERLNKDTAYSMTGTWISKPLSAVKKGQKFRKVVNEIVTEGTWVKHKYKGGTGQDRGWVVHSTTAMIADKMHPSTKVFVQKEG